MRLHEITERKKSNRLRLVSYGVEQGNDMMQGRWRAYHFNMMIDDQNRGLISVKRYKSDPSDAEVSVWGDGANTLGASVMRQLLSRIKKRFPDLAAIHGRRISGAGGSNAYHMQRLSLK